MDLPRLSEVDKADQRATSWNDSNATERPTAQHISTLTPDALEALERLSIVEQTYSYSSPRGNVKDRSTEANPVVTISVVPNEDHESIHPEKAPVQRETDLHTPPPPYISHDQEKKVSSVSEQMCNNICAINEFESPIVEATTWNPIVINFVPTSTATTTPLKTSNVSSASSVAVTVTVPQLSSTPVSTTANISSTTRTVGNHVQLAETNRRVIYTATKQQQHISPRTADTRSMDDTVVQLRKATVESLYRSIMQIEGKIFKRSTSKEDYVERCKKVLVSLGSLPEEQTPKETKKVLLSTSTQTELQPTATASTQSETPLQRLKEILSKEPRAMIETVFYDWIAVDLMLQTIKNNSMTTIEDDQPSREIEFDQDDFETQFDKFLNYCSIIFQDSN